jgi:hypothetical protein
MTESGIGVIMNASWNNKIFFAPLSLLHKYRLCFDKLSMNGKKFNDFNTGSVRPERSTELVAGLSKGKIQVCATGSFAVKPT